MAAVIETEPSEQTPLSFILSNCERIDKGVYKPFGSGMLDKKVLQHARSGGAFGGEDSPDSMQPKSKNGKGYIISHLRNNPKTFVKLLPTTNMETVSVMKFVPEGARGKWENIDLHEIENASQLLETLSWLSLIFRIKDDECAAVPEFAKARTLISKVYSTALEKMKAANARKRSIRSAANAQIREEQAARDEKKAAKKILRVRAGKEEESDDDDDDVTPPPPKNAPTVKVTPKRKFSSLKEENEFLKKKMEYVLGRRGYYARLTTLLKQKNEVSCQISALMVSLKRQRQTDVPDDLKTKVVNEEIEDEEEADDEADEEEEEDMEDVECRGPEVTV